VHLIPAPKPGINGEIDMKNTGLRNLLTRPLIGLALMICGSVSAAAAEEAVSDSVRLPTIQDLAAVLSEPASRTDALLTLIAIVQMLPANVAVEQDQASLPEALFRDNRAWLDRLVARYSNLPSRSTILDPAAWFIQQELGQHEIIPPARVSPLGPENSALMAQTFDRSDERLAAALLPEVLFQTEFSATTVWRQILDQAASNQPLMQFLSGLAAEWLDPWTAAARPVPGKAKIREKSLDDAVLGLNALMASVVLPQPPDDMQARALEFGLLTSVPEMDQNQRRTARQILYLARAIDGLHDRRYLEFIQSLLWVTADLLDIYSRNPDANSPLPAVLTDFLPKLSSEMARNFADVDSRLNTNLAAAFDTARELQNESPAPLVLARLRRELADTVTQFVLLVPEMAFYFDQPVRKRISEEVNICISVAAVRDDNGRPVMSRNQFDGCVESLSQLADTVVRSAELAGDPGGPFAEDQLRRELEMAPWQRVNYTLGYLHERSPPVCPMSERPLPNPLEWSALATLMVWFTSQSPVYAQTRSNEAIIVAMRQQGLDLLRVMAQQIDCISGSSGRFNDLVSASLQQYQEALLNLTGGIREAELQFREQNLRAGADVDLNGTVQQATAYRTPGLVIGPCEESRVCEMNQPLEATRALVGQFPDEYLIADQTGLGQVEICYDNMQWVQRRAEQVRPEEPNVSNYYGHLSFDLVGRYRQGDNVEEVFGSNFVSPDEYYYLIAASSQEVLDDGCPTEWVGSRIVTTRSDDERSRIVPNRLTYLAAARSRPSEVINANWSKGAEWRDWFVTGIGVKEMKFTPDPTIRERLAQHLRALYQAEQQSIYSGLLRIPFGTSPTPASPLFDLMRDLSMYKGLLRNELLLFYPQTMLDSDEVRMSMEGQNGMLDDTVLRRFQENNVAIAQVHDAGLDRLQQFQSVWKRQPEAVIRSGSVAVSIAHSIARLNALYREFFAAPQPVFAPSENGPVNGDDAQPGPVIPDR
jgi:hypothetical protein